VALSDSGDRSQRQGRGVLILGCGFTGSYLAQRLAFRGVPVFGTTRSDERALVIASRGAEPIKMDGSDPSPIRRLRGRIYGVVHSLPPQMERDGSYEDATGAILEQLGDWELESLVYLSSTSVYGDRAGEKVDERTECHPDSPRGEARLAIEGQILAADLPSMVVRPAGIYGPGRSMLHRAARGQHRLVAGGLAITNRIHVDDLAQIIDHALDRGTPGSVYLGSDASPSSQLEVSEYLKGLGLPHPGELSLEEARVRLGKNVLAMMLGSKRLDSSWTRDALDVTLRYPDFRSGLEAIWSREAPEIRELFA
jgi:nucleoside-diphosphate-sugar epimerase